jgi:RNA polymerase sigma factor (sigma-70 family)
MARSGLASTLDYLRRLVLPAHSATADALLLRRFRDDHDEEAFAALVQRHGSMVLGVCRRLLHNDHDTEDAFQAVFLVLARKSGALRKEASVASWLHGVALRVALRVRERRANHPGTHANLDALPDRTAQPRYEDASLAVDEELNRLPERYRAPLVLCYLQEQSLEEAARQLGSSPDAVRGRLWRGRQLLRERLLRRGLVAGSLLPALGTSQPALANEVVRATATTSVLFACGNRLPSTPSAPLAAEVLRSMTLHSLKSWCAIVLLLACLAGATAWLSHTLLPAAQPGKPADSTTPESRLLPGVTSGVRCVAISPDGRLLAAGNEAHEVQIWELPSGKETAILRDHPATLGSLAFSPDSRTLAVAYGSFREAGGKPSEGAVKLWDTKTGKERGIVARIPAQVRAVAFSPDGKSLAFGSTDSTVRLWDLPAEKEQAIYGKLTNYVQAVAFSRDGKHLAAVTADGPPAKGFPNPSEVCVWATATREKLFTTNRYSPEFSGVAFDPEGRWVAAANQAETILWDLTGKERTRIPGHAGRTTALAVSPDGRMIATGGLDRVVRLWDAGGEHLLPLTDHAASVRAAAFSPDGKTLAVGCGDRDAGEVRLWSLASILAQVERERGIALPGPATALHVLARSPDGRWLAGARSDRTVSVWDLDANRLALTLPAHDHPVHGLAFRPDGKALAVAFGRFDPAKPNDGTGAVRVWDLTTGKEEMTLARCQCEVRAVAWSPDGKSLATGGTDCLLRLWEVATGKETDTLLAFHKYVHAVAFSPDGRRLAAATREGPAVDGRPYPAEVKVWYVASKRLNLDITTTGREVHSLAFSPDSKHLATGEENELALWSLDEAKELRRQTAQASRIKAVAFSPDGKTLAFGDDHGTIRLWNAADGTERSFTRRVTGEVRGLAFTADGKELLATEADGERGAVRRWSPDDDRRAAFFFPHEHGIYALAVSSDARHMAVAVNLSTARWDLTTGRALPALRLPDYYMRGVAISPDGQTIATASENWNVKLWDATTGQVRTTLEPHRGRVGSVAYSRDGRYLASSVVIWVEKPRSRTGEVKVWDVNTGKPVCAITAPEGIGETAFSPDGKHIYAACWDGTARAWEVSTGKEAATWRGRASTRTVAVSPDGKLIASGNTDGSIQLWEVASEKMIATLTGHSDVVRCIAFSPDGKMLASASSDSTVRLWDVEAQRERYVLRGHLRDVFGLAFFPDGRTLASGGEDRVVRFWDVTTGRERPRP